jgi:phage terminase small subunit
MQPAATGHVDISQYQNTTEKRNEVDPKITAAPIGARNHKVKYQCGLCVRIRAQAASAQQKEMAGRKVRRRLTPRNRRFVQEFSDPSSPGHRNVTQAARLAGYSPDSADDIGAQLLRSAQVQELIGRELEKAGITSEFLFSGLKEGLRAEEVKLVTKNGRFSDERRPTDYFARAKYQEMAHRLRGDMQKEPAVQQAALIIRLPAEAKAEGSERYLETYFTQQSKGGPD